MKRISALVTGVGSDIVISVFNNYSRLWTKVQGFWEKLNADFYLGNLGNLSKVLLEEIGGEL